MDGKWYPKHGHKTWLQHSPSGAHVWKRGDFWVSYARFGDREVVLDEAHDRPMAKARAEALAEGRISKRVANWVVAFDLVTVERSADMQIVVAVRDTRVRVTAEVRTTSLEEAVAAARRRAKRALRMEIDSRLDLAGVTRSKKKVRLGKESESL